MLCAPSNASFGTSRVFYVVQVGRWNQISCRKIEAEDSSGTQCASTEVINLAPNGTYYERPNFHSGEKDPYRTRTRCGCFLSVRTELFGGRAAVLCRVASSQQQALPNIMKTATKDGAGGARWHSSAGRCGRRLLFLLAVPFSLVVGWYYNTTSSSEKFSEFVQDRLDFLYLEALAPFVPNHGLPVAQESLSPQDCFRRLVVHLHQGRRNVKRHDQPFRNLTIVLHRNGEAAVLGRTEMDILEGLEGLLQREAGPCPANFEKYETEALLTRLLASLLVAAERPSSSTSSDHQSEDTLGLFPFCDRGEARTPVLLDHEQLVEIAHEDGSSSLPCHFHAPNGLRVSLLPQLAQMARATESSGATCSVSAAADMECESSAVHSHPPRELHLYAVPAGRIFQFAARKVGQVISLPHVKGVDSNEQTFLEVISVKPRIFHLHNFFDRGDTDDLIDGALRETRDAYRIKRSTTGTSSVNSRRTSENGFDTHGAVAMKLKRRGMSLLGFDEYAESFTDGLQILRYNESTAYNSHLDWMEPIANSKHDFDSSAVGGNRFATILLYLSDMGDGDGGETVFTEVLQSPGDGEHVTREMVRIALLSS